MYHSATQVKSALYSKYALNWTMDLTFISKAPYFALVVLKNVVYCNSIMYL